MVTLTVLMYVFSVVSEEEKRERNADYRLAPGGGHVLHRATWTSCCHCVIYYLCVCLSSSGSEDVRRVY